MGSALGKIIDEAKSVEHTFPIPPLPKLPSIPVHIPSVPGLDVVNSLSELEDVFASILAFFGLMDVSGVLDAVHEVRDDVKKIADAVGDEEDTLAHMRSVTDQNWNALGRLSGLPAQFTAISKYVTEHGAAMKTVEADLKKFSSVRLDALIANIHSAASATKTLSGHLTTITGSAEKAEDLIATANRNALSIDQTVAQLQIDAGDTLKQIAAVGTDVGSLRTQIGAAGKDVGSLVADVPSLLSQAKQIQDILKGMGPASRAVYASIIKSGKASATTIAQVASTGVEQTQKLQDAIALTRKVAEQAAEAQKARIQAAQEAVTAITDKMGTLTEKIPAMAASLQGVQEQIASLGEKIPIQDLTNLKKLVQATADAAQKGGKDWLTAQQGYMDLLTAMKKKMTAMVDGGGTSATGIGSLMPVLLAGVGLVAAGAAVYYARKS